ncbi:hypothetical protein CMV_027963 [Castanea mollissima]|uniref:Uncharacterized protein n=1 Tax=Castanea mollissima TaxID=60419 RepID=A0A8J4Q936_9ROSI|nr:hypothetical protein CMV_027963 [Castanea mollissima]
MEAHYSTGRHSFLPSFFFNFYREMQCGANEGGDVHGGGGDSRGSEPSSGDPGEANEHTGGWCDGNFRKAGW